jgi:hypothetical protein
MQDGGTLPTVLVALRTLMPAPCLPDPLRLNSKTGCSATEGRQRAGSGGQRMNPKGCPHPRGVGRCVVHGGRPHSHALKHNLPPPPIPIPIPIPLI